MGSNLDLTNQAKIATATSTIEKVVDIILSKNDNSLIKLDNFETLNAISNITKNVIEFKVKQYIESNI